MTSTQSQLQRIGQRFAYLGASEAVYCLSLCLRNVIARDLVRYIIAPLVFATRENAIWTDANEIALKKRKIC
jgi:hypothetical protein